LICEVIRGLFERGLRELIFTHDVTIIENSQYGQKLIVEGKPYSTLTKMRSLRYGSITLFLNR